MHFRLGNGFRSNGHRRPAKAAFARILSLCTGDRSGDENEPRHLGGDRAAQRGCPDGPADFDLLRSVPADTADLRRNLLEKSQRRGGQAQGGRQRRGGNELPLAKQRRHIEGKAAGDRDRLSFRLTNGARCREPLPGEGEREVRAGRREFAHRGRVQRARADFQAAAQRIERPVQTQVGAHRAAESL